MNYNILSVSTFLLLAIETRIIDAKMCQIEEKHPVSSFHETVEKSYALCSYSCGWRSTQYKNVETTCYQRNCYLEYETIEKWVCCEGYFAKGSECIPVCSNGCHNGNCTAPETCTCNAGYAMENGKCTAQCSNCANGNCVAPNVCECSAGFVKSKAGLCVKRCSEDCVNGFCNDQDQCVCREGFYFNEKLLDFGIKNNTVCTAKCDKQCVNGWCAGRNLCKCLHGYELDARDSFKCVPVCRNCTGGICTAPNQCECPVGFVQQDGTCIPKCHSSCINGYCSDPDKCVCHDGFRMSYKPNVCEPVCDMPCENGSCVGVNECKCLNGYRSISNGKCEPICDKKYIDVANGKCIEPNVLQCDEGYSLKQSADRRLTCVSMCHPPCENATCTASGICECYQGYQSVVGSSHSCEPVCDPLCVNSHCTAPNICECQEGYRKSANVSNNVCEFYCQLEVVDCSKGLCTDVNTCECPENYELLEHPDGVLRCTPVCDQVCNNALCSEEKSCKCFPGYKPLNSTDCEPICEQECVNGICKEPNVCECNTGYKSKTNFSCEPFCDPTYVNCTHGVCVKPNVCECHDSYNLTRVDDHEECQPVCDFLPNNTICIAPGEHRCQDGHELGHPHGHCVPTCEQDCGNGTCSAPNFCECDFGFNYDISNKTCTSVCEKMCRPESGTCENLLCKCLEGYQNLENSFQCSPVCDRCLNGHCIAPGVCQCFEGFQLSNVTSSCELVAVAQTTSEGSDFSYLYIVLIVSTVVVFISAIALGHYYRKQRLGKSYACKYDSSVERTNITDDMSESG
ncbi:protein draper-like [Uranotaenia lowii]|uniref:protein draper-like n=1 Tax=Uranotaenia lowii TaxID=190385 RepID=UPI002479BEA5|nr:protein draper-like [Uranotaenia lowii]